MSFGTLAVHTEGAVAHVVLNRPDRANALDGTMWRELQAAFDWVANSEARVAILSGHGAHFCAGIDLGFLAKIGSEIGALPPDTRAPRLEALIRDLQAANDAAERCPKPVIAAVHGACIGGGLDLAAACDFRFATRDARFSVKEVDLAIVADLGILQRLPRLIGEGLARELAYTGREFDGQAAEAMRLVNAAFADREALIAHAKAVAETIAGKSPLAIRGIKASMNFSRDCSVAEGLAHIAKHNAVTLFSRDLDEVIAARREQRLPRFED